MRFVTYLMLTLLSFSACKKAVQQKEEDLLIQLIVNGQWVISKYTINSTDLGPLLFSHYRFQFKKDFSVDAINDSTVENTGTWNGSIATRTITANFPNPNSTLALLNGTWLVTDSGLDYVEATQTVNGESRFLHMDKK